MPFIDERRAPQDLSNIASPDQPELDPSLIETFGAAFRTQNTVGSYLSSRGMPDPYQIEDGFDAIDYVKDDAKYAPYVDEFAGIFNRKSADAKKLQIDREEQDRRTLDAAGTIGVFAQVGAGVFDLPTLIPLIGPEISTARAVVTTGARLAVGGGIDAAISETALQATQATRTGSETALNIGGSIILGGALGALVGRYLGKAETLALSRKVETQETSFGEMDAALTRGQSAGAAAADRGPLTLKDEAIISKLPIVNRQDPMIRLQLGELEAGRQAVRQMAETPLEYADNALGVATEKGGSVETRMKMWHAPLYKAMRGIDTEYAKYYHNTPEPSGWQRRLSPSLSEIDRWRGGKKMTFAEFKQEVGRAAYMGGVHEEPAVAAAAKMYRELDDQLKQAAIEARIPGFTEDMAVAGDISHRFRMYDKQRIIAERGTFKQRLVDYFKAGQEAAGFRAEEISLGNKIVGADRLGEKYNQVFERLTRLEDRLNQRKDVRGNKMSAAEKARQLRFDVMKERAPKQLVDMLRGKDETASMVDAVKQARADARSSAAKQTYAGKYPVLALIKNKGGVRVGSKLDYELRAMDITPKSHPGLFRKDGGIGDVDNFVQSEDAFLTDLPGDGAGYVEPTAIMQAIRDEVGGNPLRSPDQLAAEAAMESLDRVASDWLERVGLPQNATVKDVRDFINRVLGAEKDLGALDTKISKLESEIEDFDRATDSLINERDITAQEAATIAEEVNKLDEELATVGDLANASPRVGMMVDYAKTERDLFKAKLRERTLKTRTDAIEALDRAGRASEEMLAELAAKTVDLERLGASIENLKAKADKLDPMVPKANDLAKAEEFASLLPGEIDSLADETINTILGHAEGRIPYDIVAGPRGALKERILKIETAKIHEFVQNDIEEVMRAQIRTMSADIELSKKFGSVDLKEQIAKINDEADARIANAPNKAERQRLEKARTDAIRDVEGIRDRLRGTYALPNDPSSLVLRAGRIARNLNYLRLLGGMTVSAIPDMGKVVFQHGLTSTFRDGFIPMVKNFKAFRLAAEEVKSAGTALDMVLDSRTMAMADIMGEFGHNSKLERGITALSTKFGVVSLMAPWNAAMKQFAGLVTMTNILKAAERVAAGKGTAKDIRRLAESSIDEDLARRIAAQYAQYGEDLDGVLVAKGESWTDANALEAFRAAVVRDVDRVVVTPGQDKPLWMSTELGKTVGQFKSFGVSSMQRTMLAGLQQRDAATLNGVLLMLGLGAFTYWAKQRMADREVSDEPAVWAAEAFDKSGLTGYLMDINNIAEKASRGRVGLSAITGKEISRYASRNVTGAFLGPTADAVSDIFQVSGSIFAGDTTKSDLHKMRQLLPAQNLFYIRGLLNQVEEATGDTLGLPETRKN